MLSFHLKMYFTSSKKKKKITSQNKELYLIIINELYIKFKTLE